MPANLLDEDAVADRLNITTRTLQSWRRKSMKDAASSIGPAFVVIGIHTVRYREEDIQEYLRTKRRGGEAQKEPEGWRKAMARAAACLDAVSQWQNAPDKAKGTVTTIRDELRSLIGVR